MIGIEVYNPVFYMAYDLTHVALRLCWLFSGGLRSYLEHVVAMRVAQVPSSNLCAHVPAVKGASGKLETPTVKQHPRDGG